MNSDTQGRSPRWGFTRRGLCFKGNSEMFDLLFELFLCGHNVYEAIE